MTQLATYSPKDILLIVAGIIIDGYGDGTFIKVSRNTETFTRKAGAGGFQTRTMSADRSGKIEISLSQSSPDNAKLAILALTDETTGDGIVPIMVKDKRGTSLHAGEASWVVKPSDAEYAKESGNRTWIFEVADLEHFVGGNTTFGN